MSDELDIVRRHRPEVPGPATSLAERARRDLMETIANDTDARRRTLRRRRFTLLATATLVLGAGGAYAAFRGGEERATSIACNFGELGGNTPAGSDAVAASGDPIADCTAVWQQSTNVPVPPLRAFEKAGTIVVTGPGVYPPDGATPLSDGFRQDLRVLQLEHELADINRGLGGRECLDFEAARTRVDAQFDRLGLVDWKVVARAPKPNGVTRCAAQILDGPARTVTVYDGARPFVIDNPDLQRTVDFAAAIQTALFTDTKRSCPSAHQAIETIKKLATEHDVASQPGGGYRVVPAYRPEDTPDGRTTCARESIAVYGTVLVFLDSVAPTRP